MENIIKISLIIPMFLFAACDKKEEPTPKKEQQDKFQFEYVKNEEDTDFDLVEFKYSMPGEYSHVIISEKVYEYDKEVTEKIILEQDLEQTSGIIQIKKEDDLSDDNQMQLNFEILISSEKSFVSPNNFPIKSEYFNLFWENTVKVNKPKINLYAYKGKKIDESNGSIEITNQIFEDNYDVSSSLEKDEVIIIWSCEFTKE